MRKAFTLVELAVVVAVIGIVASLAAPQVKGIIEEARIRQALSFARVLESAKDAYLMANPGESGTVEAARMAPYYPAGTVPPFKTPFNTEYENVYDLDNPVKFTHEGKTYSCMSLSL